MAYMLAKLRNIRLEAVKQRLGETGGYEVVHSSPGLEIGVAEYAEGPTGCTVFAFGKYVSLHVDVRGGSPGVIGDGYPIVDAICFAGGSVYGLEAATGVAAELFARGVQWIHAERLHFPTRERIVSAFEGFDAEVMPLWGATPFNNYLFVFTRPS